MLFIGVKVKPELLHRLKDYAQKNNITLSEIIRDCIKKEFEPNFENIK